MHASFLIKVCAVNKFYFALKSALFRLIFRSHQVSFEQVFLFIYKLLLLPSLNCADREQRYMKRIINGNHRQQQQ